MVSLGERRMPISIVSGSFIAHEMSVSMAGGMVALVGAYTAQAQAVCQEVLNDPDNQGDEVLGGGRISGSIDPALAGAIDRTTSPS